MQFVAFLLLVVGHVSASDVPSLRKLMEQTAQLPSACSNVCPNAGKPMKSIQTSMGIEMSGSGATGSVKPDMAKDVKAMMGSMLDGMCANKEAFQCVAANANVCAPSEGQGSAGSAGFSPTEMASQLGCVCDACPNFRHAYVDMIAGVMGSFGDVDNIAAPGGNSSSTASDPNAMYAMICPLIHVLPCLNSKSECKAMLSQMGGSSSGSGAEGSGKMMPFDMSDMEQAAMMGQMCNTMNYTTAAPASTDNTAAPASTDTTAAPASTDTTAVPASTDNGTQANALSSAYGMLRFPIEAMAAVTAALLCISA